ncbi:MAG TPA: glycosyltransferase [Vicinamibacterales bacterium]
MARILFAGQIDEGQTSLMRLRALARLGHTVHGVNTTAPWARASWLARQIQRHRQAGSIVDRINADVLRAARELRPDLVWAEKQEYLWAETLHDLRKLGARLVHFTPDPYFSLVWKQTRVMDEAMRAFDVLVYCKSYERPDYEALGRPVVYMPLGFCDETHRPVPSGDARWQSAVSALGGWEPHRQQMMHAVAASGLDVKIWGRSWDFLRDGRWTPRRHLILRQLAGDEPFSIERDELLARSLQGGEVYGDEYARALTGAKIGIGFLRKICPEQHTTRTFEIPACGSLLLAERTTEHQSLFEEGRDAEFFASCEELVDKVRYYCRDEAARQRVATAGYQRCMNSRYAYVHRLDAALRDVAAA